MLKNPKLLLLLILVMTQCKSKRSATAYNSESLKIIPLSDHSFLHISYLQTASSGIVACNGYLYLNQGEALVFDTPSDTETTRELLDWLENTKKQKVKGLIVNHFHVDAMGGISEFHQKNIPTYANKKTQELVVDEEKKPLHTFETSLTLNVGGNEVINHYFGEGHTVDNIASYIPSEKLLFGGCLVKSLNASKGNLEDANTNAWSATIEKIKKTYPTIKTVIPGHGRIGGTELLDYTITLFKTN